MGLWVEAGRLVRKRVRFRELRLGFTVSPGCMFGSFILLDFLVARGRLCDFPVALGF